MTSKEKNHAKRKDRQKQTAEVFTPDTLVEEMLAKLPKEVWKKGKTFLDPACGNGQFNVHVLQHKLKHKHAPLYALKSIFGADVMKDNIQECRHRLLDIISQNEKVTKKHVESVLKNIIWIDMSKYPLGSLGGEGGFDLSDYEFNDDLRQDDIDAWFKNWNKEELDDLPVRCAKKQKPKKIVKSKKGFVESIDMFAD